MKKHLHRLFAVLLALTMLTGTFITAHAADFKFPNAYWALQNEWTAAIEAENVNQTITAVEKIYNLLRPMGLGPEVCQNLEPKCARAAWCSEIKGDISGAITWLQRQRECAQWLDYDLMYIDAKIAVLQAANSPAVYVLTDDASSSYPGTGAPASGTLYGSAITSAQSGESSTLVYITFNDGYSMEHWIDYYSSTSPAFAQILSGGVFELAWNFYPESTAGAQAVLSADSYINESLATLGKLNATVLLRVGAEMNLWCDADTYIQAFRKVASAARPYSNIKLVFSPNDLSGPNADFKDFYPGDEYVDWIGMSTYHNSNYAAVTGGNKTTPSYSYSYPYNASYECAYWNEGIYDDPLAAVAPIMNFAASHGKPVMISECGFSYYNKSTGTDQTAYATAQTTRFYSYVNMIYPQVKAVFLFNTDVSSSKYSYELSGSSSVKAAYDAAITNNGAYLKAGASSAGSWKRLDQAVINGGTIKLATYESLPGRNNGSVRYYVDGKQVATVSQAPYYYSLDTDSLSNGTHTIKAEVVSGQFTVSTKTYSITVTEPGNPFIDVPRGQYYHDPVLWAAEKGITGGTSANTFSPSNQCTRAQIVTFLWRAAGSPSPVTTDSPFTDVADKSAFYYNAVLWAVENGITGGTSATTFSPDKTCTRAEAVTFLHRYAGSPSVDGQNPFADVAAGQFYYEPVLWAVANSITGGTSTTTFSPNNVCSRADIVTFLYRYLGKA